MRIETQLGDVPPPTPQIASGTNPSSSSSSVHVPDQVHRMLAAVAPVALVIENLGFEPYSSRDAVLRASSNDDGHVRCRTRRGTMRLVEHHVETDEQAEFGGGSRRRLSGLVPTGCLSANSVPTDCGGPAYRPTSMRRFSPSTSRTRGRWRRGRDDPQRTNLILVQRLGPNVDQRLRCPVRISTKAPYSGVGSTRHLPLAVPVAATPSRSAALSIVLVREAAGARGPRR